MDRKQHYFIGHEIIVLADAHMLNEHVFSVQ